MCLVEREKKTFEKQFYCGIVNTNNVRIGGRDTQHNDTQHNDIQHTTTQHNDTQHNDIQHNDTQHNYTMHDMFIVIATFSKSYTQDIYTQHSNKGYNVDCCYAECQIFNVVLSIIVLSVVMLSVVAQLLTLR